MLRHGLMSSPSVLTEQAKAWVVHLACSKPKESGYPVAGFLQGEITPISLTKNDRPTQHNACVPPSDRPSHNVEVFTLK